MPGATAELTIADVVREHRRSFPDAVAMVDGPVRLTWAELDQRTSQLADALATAGFGAGDRLLWLGQGSFRVMEALIAVGKLGGILCPANWRLSEAELSFVIDDVAPSVVVGQVAEVGDTLAGLRARQGTGVVWLDHDIEGDGSYEAFVAGGAPTDPSVLVDPDDPVLLLYTAAFAGTPNGSMLSHRNLMAQSLSLAWLADLGPQTVYLNSGPMFHIANFMWSVPTMLHGGVNVFVPRVEAAALAEVIETQRCTRALLMPPTVAAMVEHCWTEPRDLSSLLVADAGAWDGLASPDETRWGRAPGGFGQTEVTGYVTFNGYGPPGTGNSGRPGPLSAVRVVDDEGRELRTGEVGEIVARGPIVHLGYWNRPDLNAARFAGGWWHTGDLGRRESDGSLHFIGPRTRMIKSGGENIYPAEVEACVRSHPDVADVAVIGKPSERWGQSVAAVVVRRPGTTLRGDDVVAHCRERMASYKKPSEVVFVDELPRRNWALDYDLLDERHGGGGYPGGANVGA